LHFSSGSADGCSWCCRVDAEEWGSVCEVVITGSSICNGGCIIMCRGWATGESSSCKMKKEGSSNVPNLVVVTLMASISTAPHVVVACRCSFVSFIWFGAGGNGMSVLDAVAMHPSVSIGVQVEWFAGIGWLSGGWCWCTGKEGIC